MYIVYVDGSGSVKSPSEKYFILAGVSVFEHQIFHLMRQMDAFVESLGLDTPEEIELHASVIASGREKPWKGIPRKVRLQIIEDALDVVRQSRWSVSLFAVAVHKAQRSPNDPVEYAFEEICNRFDLQLKRILHRSGKKEKHRGLVVMDKSSSEGELQRLARTFRVWGTRWGKLHSLVEVPLFVDSQASRLIQVADLVAWAVWRRYEYQDTRYLDKIVSRFDSEGGVLHGLVHFAPKDGDCHCPACFSRVGKRSSSSA